MDLPKKKKKKALCISYAFWNEKKALQLFLQKAGLAAKSYFGQRTLGCARQVGLTHCDTRGQTHNLPACLRSRPENAGKDAQCIPFMCLMGIRCCVGRRDQNLEPILSNPETDCA